MVGAVGLDRESLEDAVGDSELTTAAYSGELVILMRANPVLLGRDTAIAGKGIIPWYVEATRSLLQASHLRPLSCRPRCRPLLLACSPRVAYSSKLAVQGRGKIVSWKSPMVHQVFVIALVS